VTPERTVAFVSGRVCIVARMLKKFRRDGQARILK